PQILGQAENAHRALLERALTGTGLTYRTWVTLKIAAAGGPATRDQLAGRVAGALKIDVRAAGESIAHLTAAGLLEDRSGRTVPTAQGDDLHQRLSAGIGRTISRLYSAVSPDDLEVAGRVLAAVTARADAELANA
ncbi:MAG: winged helix DNA-binding protein, partial [Nonomuraea sp.]|nr:winged helix DNA-binding protein [Nonomuraea sp.]